MKFKDGVNPIVFKVRWDGEVEGGKWAACTDPTIPAGAVDEDREVCSRWWTAQRDQRATHIAVGETPEAALQVLAIIQPKDPKWTVEYREARPGERVLEVTPKGEPFTTEPSFQGFELVIVP